MVLFVSFHDIHVIVFIIVDSFVTIKLECKNPSKPDRNCFYYIAITTSIKWGLKAE